MLNDTKLAIKQALKRAHTQKAVHSIDSILSSLHMEKATCSQSRSFHINLSETKRLVSTIMTSLSSIHFSKGGKVYLENHSPLQSAQK